MTPSVSRQTQRQAKRRIAAEELTAHVETRRLPRKQRRAIAREMAVLKFGVRAK